VALLHEINPEPVTTSRVPRRHVTLNFIAVPRAFAAVDAGLIVTLGVACGVVYDALIFGQVGDIGRYFGLGIAVAILFSSWAHARGLYLRSRLQQLILQIKDVLVIWTIVFLCIVTIAFALKVSDALSRVTVLLFFVTGFGAIAVLRWGTNRVLVYLARSGAFAKRQVVVVGHSGWSVPTSVAQAIDAAGCNIRQIILLPAISDKGRLSECMRELIYYVRQHSVDEVLLATNWGDTTLIETVTEYLRAVPLPVKLIPDPLVSALLHRPLVAFGNTKAIELQRAPLSRPQLEAKRLLDLVVTMPALLVLLPLLGLVAAAIALDSPGPVLFRQRRIGLNGQEFHIYKFRTMRVLENGAIIQQACQADRRVTSVGRLLRKFSMDELPQLLNVLKGEMSLVGPRPHALAHDREYGQMITLYAARHNVKPGVTGWAQVNGWRGPTPQIDMMTRRVEHDLWYVDHWSLWLDIKILFATLPSVCRAQNAY
jgi:Undecaprenyl-phosphate glucose phosphotransferase